MSAKNQVNSFLKHTPFTGYLYAALISNVIAIVAILVLGSFLPPVVPLLYGRPSGETQLVPSYALIIAPGVALVITIINAFLTKLVKDEFMQKILIVSAFILSMLTTITVFKIVFLVGFF